MPRCQFTDFRFEHTEHPGPYSGDKTEQCWMEDTREFDIEGEKQHRCIFHAPRDVTTTDWPLSKRNDLQSAIFKRLITRWNSDNRMRLQTGEEPYEFLLPQIEAGRILLQELDSLGSLMIPESRLEGLVLADSTVYGELDLGHSEIRDALLLQGTDIESTLNLWFTKIERFASIRDSRISCIDLRNTTFNAPLSMAHGCVGTLRVIDTILNAGSDISMTEICKVEYMSHFGLKLKFMNVTFRDPIDDISAFKDLWFGNADCSNVAFLGCNVAYLNFIDSDISETKFVSCDWRGATSGSDYCKLGIHDRIVREWNAKGIAKLMSVYTQLKRAYADARDFRQAGDFHFREMELRRKLAREGGWSFERAALALYHWVADFGENYQKLGLWLIGSFFIFGAFVTVIEGYAKGFHLYPWYALPKTYFKEVALTFLAIIPSTFRGAREDGLQGLYWLSKALLMLETVIAAALATLFVMAIRRRFRR